MKLKTIVKASVWVWGIGKRLYSFLALWMHNKLKQACCRRTNHVQLLETEAMIKNWSEKTGQQEMGGKHCQFWFGLLHSDYRVRMWLFRQDNVCVTKNEMRSSAQVHSIQMFPVWYSICATKTRSKPTSKSSSNEIQHKVCLLNCAMSICYCDM